MSFRPTWNVPPNWGKVNSLDGSLEREENCSTMQQHLLVVTMADGRLKTQQSFPSSRVNSDGATFRNLHVNG